MGEEVRIREATPEDLGELQAIEAAGDALFADLFGPEPFGTDSAESGDARAAQPGVVLVAVVDSEDGAGTEAGNGARARVGMRTRAEADGRVVGFAHLLEVGAAGRGGDPAEVHLEQLAVLPAWGRRGIGRSLVEAACAWAVGRDHVRITLRTYAEVPWNAPFYARCGFREVDLSAHHGAALDTAFQRGLVAAERAADLGRHGRRVLMVRELCAERHAPPSPSS